MSEAPFEAAAGQAVQAAAMSIRFMITVSRVLADRSAADAARLDGERAGQVERLRQLADPGGDAAERYARIVREQVTNPDIRDALLNSEQWPQIAADLAVLDRAGVDVRELLADASRTADRIAASLTPRPQSTQEFYAQMVRDNVPDARVRDPLLNSEQWPQIAEQMRQLHAAGVDMPQLLDAASRTGVALHTTLQQAWERTANRAATLSAENSPERTSRATVTNPRGRGREDSALRTRASSLRELGLSNQESQLYVRMVRDTIHNEHHAGMLVVSRQWPQIAAKMRDLEARGIDPATRLARLPQEIARRAATGQRVDIAAAAADALSKPAPATASTSTKTAAATSTSTTTPAPAPAAAPSPPTPLVDPTPTPAPAPVPSPELLRDAAHVAVGLKYGVNAQILAKRMGIDTDQARGLVKELAARDIIGRYDQGKGMRYTQVINKESAELLLNNSPGTMTAVQANKAVQQTSPAGDRSRSRTAAAATANSTTVSASPTAPGPAPAAAPSTTAAHAPASRVKHGPSH
jgi:hypothetical protein